MRSADMVARREQAVGWLMPLFCLSGATALVWQSLWGRQLHLVFGTSTFAITTVLSAFMCGLALGGAVAAARVHTLARPLRAYGWLEIGIGVYAALFPALLSGIEPVYLWLWRETTPTPVLYGVEQFLLVGTLLLPPTAAMGATLPLLARFAAVDMGAAGGRVGTLYAVNTAGAVVGTFVCGFVFLPVLGLHTTTMMTAAANVALGLVALLVDRTVQDVPVSAPVVSAADVPVRRAVLVSMAIAGFASLIYEVAYFRVLGLTLGASVYAFSVMLLAFLVGIALGGRVGGGWADRLLERRGLEGVLVALVGVELAVGASAWGLMYVFPELPYWYVWGFDLFGAAGSGRALWAMSLLIAGALLLLPTTLLGLAFPLAVRSAIGAADDVGGAVGRVYAANTAGGVLGAALAGFVLLPWLRVQGTITLAAACNVLAALAAWQALPSGPAARRTAAGGLSVVAVAGALAAAAPPPWDPMMMTAGMYKYANAFKDHSREGIRRYSIGNYELLYYEEGLSSVVTVARSPKSGNIWLANNGKIDASTSYDMPTQIMVSLLPMQFVQRPEDVLVIGLASGITAGAVTLVPEVQRLEIAELEPATVEAAGFFTAWNHGVLDDPRTRLFLNDGRNHVLLAAPGSFDVIVSEPSNPWLSGVSNLFTLEFLQMGKTRLKEGGVWSQWVQLYGMDDADLRSLIGTFTEVYPHVLVYSAALNADLVLLGSDHPLIPTLAATQTLYDRPAVSAQLSAIEMGDMSTIFANLLFDRDRAVALAGDYQVNTDDNMRIEYNAPLHLHDDTQSVNVPLLREHAWLPVELLGEDPALWERTARAWFAVEEKPRAILGMTRSALLLPEEDPRRAERLEQAFAWFFADRTDKAGVEEVAPGLAEVVRQDFVDEIVAEVQATL